MIRLLVGAVRRRRLAPGTTFAAFKHRDYRLFFAGQFVSLVGTWMQNIAQPWLVYDLTKSPMYLGVVAFAPAVPVLFLSLYAGVFVDRVSKRKLLILTQTLAMAQAFLLAADVLLGWVQPWHIVIFALGLGAINAFDAPARQSFIVEMVGRGGLQNAIGLNAAMFQSARIIGPSIAGVLLAVVGPGWCFFLNGISFLAALVSLRLMAVLSIVGAAGSGDPRAQMREGLAYVRGDGVVRSLLGMVAVANVFAFGYAALLPAFARDVLHGGPQTLGYLSAAVGVGALAGALAVASLGDFRHKGRLLVAGNVFFPAMVLVFSFSKSLPLSLAALVGAGLGFMVQNAMTNTLVQTSVPDHLRGRVMSVYMLVFLGLFPIGSLLAGTIAQHFGVPAGAACGGGIALAAGLFWLWRLPYIRRLP